MNIKIIDWLEADVEQLHELYVNFPYPPYFGSPIVDERLQEYRFKCVKNAAETSSETLLVAVNDGKVLCAAQLRRTDHLSDHFGIEVASIDNEAYVCDNAAENTQAFLILLQHLAELANRKKVDFLTVSAASSSYHWI